MAKIYRDINIRVGLARYQTAFIGQVIEVQTENDASRLSITFPTAVEDDVTYEIYSDYAKLMDILYTSVDGVDTIETHGLEFGPSTGQYYFIVPRYITHGEILYLQFRAVYNGYTPPDENAQEVVDPVILTLRFRESLKKTDFDVIDEIPDAYTSVLQAMIDVQNVAIEEVASDSIQAFTGTTVISTAPLKIGDLYFDTVTKFLYFATGTASSADWIKVLV
jgi:hypothetical protein